MKFRHHVKKKLSEKKGVRINSLHEGYAKILEEVDELWDQVRLKRDKRDWNNVLEELSHIAAYAELTALSLNLTEK
jgi:hypothetical protein